MPHLLGRGSALLSAAALAALMPALLISGALPASAFAAAAPATSDGVTWLCQPGAAGDPCATSLTTSVVPASGSTQVVTPPTSPLASKFDCFYVYPTVSDETTPNSDLTVQPREILAAQSQAAQFSSVCNVWAPMYEQVTTDEVLSPTFSSSDPALAVAYQSLTSAFENYLKYDNDGRPIVFIGDSQGTWMLMNVFQQLVENNPALHHRTVLAIMLGANVVVPNGKTEGGTFSSIPECTYTGETGCVIAYSSYPGKPPQDAVFGIPGQGDSLITNQTATTGVHVVCTNPADLGGNSTAGLVPLFLTEGSLPTPYVDYPNLYGASCKSKGNATWLNVTKVSGSSDTRPIVTEPLGPTWGYHGDDVNLPFGNLLLDTTAAEAAWLLKNP